MLPKIFSTRILGVITVLSFAASILLFIFPYYYLGREQYIPKSNPDAGYFMPKSSEAWSFLILALILLALGSITAMLLWKKLSDAGSAWATPI